VPPKGLGARGTGATSLRKEVADFVEANPGMLVAGTPLKDWVLWDSGLTPEEYAAKMRYGSHWGGAIEIAVTAAVKQMHVHVYEGSSSRFSRISAFAGNTIAAGTPVPGGVAVAGTINLVYSGRVHYDALRIQS